MESLVRRSEEGERISQVAYTIPPIPVDGFTTTIQAVTYLLCVIATIVVGLRVYVRIKLSGQKAWGWDDIFAVGGWVHLWPSVAFLILATKWGLGAHDSQVPDGMIIYYQVRVKEYMVYFELIYFTASVLTKLAMAIMIIRLAGSSRLYSRIIWGNMVVLGVTATICLIIFFVSCSPVAALWNEKLGHCRIRNGWIIISYGGSVMLALADWTCAITPFFILQSLQMPKRKKISVQLILSLGIFGSAAGLVRMGYYHAYDTTKYPNESLYNWGQTILWSLIEATLGIIACSLPPLRKLFKKFYDSSKASSNNTPGLALGETGTELSSFGGTRKGTVLGIRRKESSQWDQLDDEQSTSSQRNIILKSG